jgi:hypothetical protein
MGAQSVFCDKRVVTVFGYKLHPGAKLFRVYFVGLIGGDNQDYQIFVDAPDDLVDSMIFS